LEKLRAENLERIKKDEEEYKKKRIAQIEIDKRAIVESAKGEIISLVTLAVKKVMEDKNK